MYGWMYGLAKTIDAYFLSGGYQFNSFMVVDYQHVTFFSRIRRCPTKIHHFNNAIKSL
jgi:hypothetical protein